MNEKYLIISDIHGSISSLKKAISIFNNDKFNKLFILGDLFYSGARNVPPSDYSPIELVELTNKYSKNIIAIKGNCESVVDLSVTKFPIFEIYQDKIFDKRVALFHGHQDYFSTLSKYNDIIFTGHTHISKVEKVGNVIYANPGSISLPKDNNKSFIIFTKDKIEILDLISLEKLKEIKI